MTNILALPLVALAIKTGNNEDWIDTVKYVVGDPTGPQLDLRGIAFLMEIRRQASDHEVLLTGSTSDLTISIGAFPNYGFLIIHFNDETMATMQAGSYVADVVAQADGFERRTLDITLTIVEGVTR